MSILGKKNISRRIGDNELKLNNRLKPEDKIISKFSYSKIENLNKEVDFVIIIYNRIYTQKLKRNLWQQIYLF